MQGDALFRRATAAFAGVLFLVLAVLVAVGFGGLGQYPLWLRGVVALAVVTYGLVRLRGAIRGVGRGSEKKLD